MTKNKWEYDSRLPYNMTFDDLDNLPEEDEYKIMKSKTFCMLPWVHIHAWPEGKVYPCCLANAAPDEMILGNLKNETLKDIWNNDKFKKIRKNMLEDKPVANCTKCYEQEESGFFSMRNSANKHWGHLLFNKSIKLNETTKEGENPDFKLRYWDIRFSNLCNFKCRTCGPMFSSQWYDDEKAIWNREPDQDKILFAGRTKTDALEQLMEHIEYVEEIYFAGGEPLIMEEHYIILKELVKRGKTNISLIYNTNFSTMSYKDQNVLEVWKDFEKVAVGASLDAMGDRAEYMRKGTDWKQICKNRENMLKICPHVDFYISPTVSIFNALHVTDFHDDWIKKGLLNEQGLNINILQGPIYYRIDNLPKNIKNHVTEKVSKHIELIDKKDSLRRAVNGFQAMLTFMNSNDGTDHLKKFSEVTKKIDSHRKENFYDVFPELLELKNYE